MALKFTQSTVGNDMQILIEGVLNEDATLPVLPSKITGRLILDLGELTMINSIGCRNWLLWVKTINADGGLVLTNCSPAFIAQVNVLKGFVPPMTNVHSFYLPYHCESCEAQDKILFTNGTDTEIPDDTPCPKCGSSMECDVVNQSYVRFLQKKSA